MKDHESTDQRRRDLERQRAEIEDRIARIQRDERSETAGGETENAQEWENAEIREGQLLEATNELRAVETALNRLDEGAYGVCSRCGTRIGAERLELLPSTDLCAACAA